MSRFLISLGLFLLLTGLLWHFGGTRVSQILQSMQSWPGNFTIKGERYVVHVPLLTCLLLSIGMSALFWLLGQFRR